MNAALGAIALDVLERVPDPAFYAAYRLFGPASLSRQPVGYRVETDAGVWHVPRAFDTLRVTRKGGGYRRKLDRYLVDPIDLSPGDRVVDVGAMIGEFAAGVERDYDADVTVLEPDPVTARCLRDTLAGDVIEVAAWDEGTELSFNVADDHSESSLFKPDYETTAKATTVAANRLDNIFDSPIDLLKIDAEGAEPEVVRGAAGLDVRQIVVDVTAERDGQSPAASVRSLLNEQGFTVSRHGDILAGVAGGDWR